MNWRLSQLDRVMLVSNSDAHSPAKLGREANVFDAEPDYYELMRALRGKDTSKFLYTVEFFPEEGKYHYDGHRNCNTRMTPREAKAAGNRCPVCKRPVTVGVMHRVEDLADREAGYVPTGVTPYRNLIPLEEIIAEAMGAQVDPTRRAGRRAGPAHHGADRRGSPPRPRGPGRDQTRVRRDLRRDPDFRRRSGACSGRRREERRTRTDDAILTTGNWGTREHGNASES